LTVLPQLRRAGGEIDGVEQSGEGLAEQTGHGPAGPQTPYPVEEIASRLVFGHDHVAGPQTGAGEQFGERSQDHVAAEIVAATPGSGGERPEGLVPDRERPR